MHQKNLFYLTVRSCGKSRALLRRSFRSSTKVHSLNSLLAKLDLSSQYRTSLWSASEGICVVGGARWIWETMGGYGKTHPVDALLLLAIRCVMPPSAIQHARYAGASAEAGAYSEHRRQVHFSHTHPYSPILSHTLPSRHLQYCPQAAAQCNGAGRMHRSVKAWQVPQILCNGGQNREQMPGFDKERVKECTFVLD